MKNDRLARIPSLGTALLLAALAGGCDFGPRHMMGQAARPASFSSNGERIYFTGTSASGDPITLRGREPAHDHDGGQLRELPRLGPSGRADDAPVLGDRASSHA